MKYYVYLRVSTKEQSVEVQRVECEKYLRDRGITEWEEYADQGYSGTLSWEDRPGLASIMTISKKGDVILIWSRDRLGRDTDETHLIEYFLRKKKVSIISVTQSTKGMSEIEEKILKTVFDLVAQLERMNHLFRTKSGRINAKRKGRLIGRVPYGFTYVEHPKEVTFAGKPAKYIIPYAPEQEILNEMIRMYDEGLLLREIKDDLNSRGIMNREGRPWKLTSVSVILRNREKHLHHLQGQTAFLQSTPQFAG